eukprot:3761517-Amphidinium_carterae.1
MPRAKRHTRSPSVSWYCLRTLVWRTVRQNAVMSVLQYAVYSKVYATPTEPRPEEEKLKPI